MQQIKNLISRFRRDEKGMALIFISLMLPVIFGFSLLVIDRSRVFNLHHDLQKAADAFAVAAAAELDGKADSITRADRALATLVDNTYRFSDDGPIVTLTDAGITRRYLVDLPTNDWDPITAAFEVDSETDDAHLARFVEVNVTPRGYSAIFPALFVTGGDSDGSFNVGATAVAGFEPSVCDFTPVYICNPYEGPVDSVSCEHTGSGPTLSEVVEDPAMRGRMIELRQQGGTTAHNTPGNYGFLQPSNGQNGANAIRDTLAAASSPSCYSARGVELRPGFLATVRDALNVRFDIYDGPMNSVKNNASFGPGNNVRKGYKPGSNACNSTLAAVTDTGYEQLPRDACFAAGTCMANTGLGTDRVGDQNWDFDKYWEENNFAATGVAKPLGADGLNEASTGNAPPRYDMYRYEIANGMVNQASVGDTANGVAGETGLAQCSGASAIPDPDRRLLYGAILNCLQLTCQGIMGPGNSSDPLPVESFASFFLTETLQSGPDQIIRVELVDITAGGLGTLSHFLRDEVQLYR